VLRNGRPAASKVYKLIPDISVLGQSCRSRKFHPALIRAMRQNQRIVLRDVWVPSAAWGVYRQRRNDGRVVAPENSIH
jgi:hypothetical protein